MNMALGLHSKKSILCLCLCLFVTACNAGDDAPRYPDRLKPLKEGDNYERKYYFKECALKLVFDWGNNNKTSDRYTVITKIGEELKKGPMVSFDYPLFSGGSQRPFNSYLFYYINYCEDKKKITKEIVETYLKDIDGFPPYRIEKIEWEDYKNAVPVGSWIDQ